MNKPAFAAVFGLALALGGVYSAFGRIGAEGPSMVTSVSIAPMSSGQDSQAKLAPLDTLADSTFASIQAATQQLQTALTSRTTAPGTQNTTTLNSDVQNFVSQVQQAVQSSQQSQSETTASVNSTGTTTASTSINGVTTTAASSLATPFATTTVTNPTAANDALAKAVDAYNQAVSKVTSLDLPTDIKAALTDYFTALRTQLLAISISDQFNAVQATAMTSNPTVDALNKFLANVNGLNMTGPDKAKTFAALLASFGSVPGVNATAYTAATNITPNTVFTAPTPQELSAQISAQMQAAIDKAMANIEAQRKFSASLQDETTNGLIGNQMSSMSAQDFTSTVLGSLNLGVLNAR